MQGNPIDPAIHDPLKADYTLPEAGAATAKPGYEPPAQVPQADILQSTQSNVGAHIQAAANARQESSVGQGIDAAIDEMAPMAAWRAWNSPDFKPQEGFTAGERIREATTELNSDDRAWLMQSQSDEEYDYRYSNIERSRANFRAIGETPWTSMPLMAIDPAYLAVDAVSLGAGRIAAVARAGAGVRRAAVGATAGAGALGVSAIENQTRPVSVGEFVINGMLNAGVTAAVYRGGKLVPKDPEYPGHVANNLASDMAMSERTAMHTENPLAPRNPDAVPGALRHTFEASDDAVPSNARVLAEDVAAVYRGTDMEELAEAILRAPELKDIYASSAPSLKAISPDSRGFIVTQKGDRPFKAIYVAAKGDADVALHELTHAVIQTRVHAPQFKHIKNELEIIRKNVLADFGANPSLEAGVTHGGKRFFRDVMGDDFNEFIAYGMASPAFRKWAKEAHIGADGARVSAPGFTPGATTLTVWDKFMDLVSSLLGTGRPRLEKFLEQQANHAAYLEGVPTQYKSLDKRFNEMLDEMSKDKTPIDMYNDGVLPASVQHNRSSSQVASSIIKNADKNETRVAKGISWSLHKTLSKFSPAAKRIADELVDDPINMTGDSVVSQTRAIRADLAQHQYVREDLLRKMMAAEGAGIMAQVLQPGKALRVQQGIERRLLREMHGREQAARQGTKFVSQESNELKAMADALDRENAAALAELKANGVEGADAVTGGPGWVSRRWDNSNIERLDEALIRDGFTAEQANRKIVQMLAGSLRRANTWDQELSVDVAQAIIERARRKGYFEDTAFRGHAGNEALAEIRSMLKNQGVPADRAQRVLDLLAGVVDEAGKPAFLKHRVDLDYRSGIMAGGEQFSVSDLLGSDITRIQESYLDRVAGQSALTRKGYGSVSELGKLRSELAHSIKDEAARKEAVDLFDQTMNSVLGNPVGEDIPQLLRASQAVTRMVGLASSGLWQVTEFATAMGRYGALKALRYMANETPYFGKMLKDVTNDGSSATELHSILTRNASADIRMRPFVQRLEDNFDIAPSSRVQLALQQAQQLVPYLNAQKYVQTKQAGMVANLAIDSLVKAGKGDQRAIEVWEQYGLKVHTRTELTKAIEKYGTDTARWPDGLWREARGPLTKAMDDAVLRNRTGEIPAFAQFSQVGKFIFTFRSFVLGAHNKVLAGTIGREGFVGISQLMLYQMPLAMLATATNGAMQGKPVQDEKELIAKSFGQMGTLGLFSDIFGIISGEKQQFGAPGLLLIDRLYKAGGQAAQGNASGAAQAAVGVTPILSIIPGVRGMVNLATE